MSILEQIRTDYLTARKEKSHTIGVLSALIGEITQKEKTFNPPRAIKNDEIVAIVKSFIKNVNITISEVGKLPEDRRADELTKLNAEISALERYLPSQMTETQLADFAWVRVEAGANLGEIMKALKETHAGEYDGKMASEVIKRVLETRAT